MKTILLFLLFVTAAAPAGILNKKVEYGNAGTKFERVIA
jgi:hypothetical protein